ncbi:MAG: PIG-L family deacetylase [Mycobacteriales bacterium]
MTITEYDPAALARLGTVLGVWAHPDDETYLCGGLMMAAVAAGSRVVCVTATRGEAGSMDHDRWPPEQLADVRTLELAVALDTFGVTEHHWLDYPDGGCAAVDAEDAVRRIAELIVEVAPDTILTFAPDGMTGHADHIAVCEWTTEAARRTGRSDRLHYATVTPTEWAQQEATFFEHGISMGGQPDVTAPADCSILVTLPVDLCARKDTAIRAQVSQTEMLIQAVGEETFAMFIATETFRLARQA